MLINFILIFAFIYSAILQFSTFGTIGLYVFIFVSLISVILGLVVHEAIHALGYYVAGSKPVFGHHQLNPYITNLDDPILLRDKLIIDICPTICGVLFLLVFILIKYIGVYTNPLLDYAITFFIIGVFSPSTMDWRNMVELKKKVRHIDNIYIIHKFDGSSVYPVAEMYHTNDDL